MKKTSPTASAMGSFTDFNVWGRVLSHEEMIGFTSCEQFMQGDLIPWNIGTQ